MPGSLWEVVLERAYQNGWRPSGTGAPWNPEGRTSSVATIGKPAGHNSGRWPESDYFSASSQHVYAEDAFELGTAVMRGLSRVREESDSRNPRRDGGLSQVATFVREGGFVIGRAPVPPRSIGSDRA